MSYKLFLDDVRFPSDVKWVQLPLGSWLIVRNYYEFVKIIDKKGLPTHISFDHDLSLEHVSFCEPGGGLASGKKIPYESYREKTGYDCAKWFLQKCREENWRLPVITVHSLNPVGRENIIKLFNGVR